MTFTRVTAALAVCTSVTLPAFAQEATLTAVYSLPPTNDLMKSYFAFVEDLNANGEGILQIEMRGGTEAIPRNEQMNAVARGIVDLYFGPGGYFQNQLPDLVPIDAASVPANKLREAGLQDAIDAATRESAGVALLALMGTGYSFQFYTIEEPPMTDGEVDLSGLKIRGGASYGPMYDALGINRVDVPAGDIYTALERGVVEGIGFTTIGVSSGGWQDFLKYRIYPTWRQGNTIIAGNAEAIDALTDEQEAYLMEMIEKHEMEAYAAAQALELVDSEALAAAGVTDIVLEGEAAAKITTAFQDTFWDGVAETMGAEKAQAYRTIVDTANAM